VSRVACGRVAWRVECGGWHGDKRQDYGHDTWRHRGQGGTSGETLRDARGRHETHESYTSYYIFYVR